MATRTAAPGLSTDELARIRDTLASGRKPKVVFTAAAGQIAGQTGQVVELTDPDLSDEWVVVRFGRDELPFSPTDLQVPVKPTARRTPASAPAPVPPAPPVPPAVTVPVPVPVPAPVPGPREELSVPPAPSTAPPQVNGARPARAAPAKADRPEDTPVETPADTPVEKPAGVTEPAPAAGPVAEKPKPARKAARPKTPPSLTVTITYAEGEWMVGATQGSKSIAKPYLIKPAEALKMVSLLDVPGVHEAVDEIVSAARTEAEQQAERLRAELAEVESRLAELRDAG